VSDGIDVRTSRVGSATLTVGRAGPSTVVCTLAGEIDLANSTALFNAVVGSLGPEDDDLVVDFAEVTYVDSAGLSRLVDIAKRMKVARHDFVVRAPAGSPAHRLLELTGLGAVLRVDAS
jgi:anti-sigma B factor antagonist